MADEPAFIEPLTLGNYKRLPKVEWQIADALTLEPEALVKRAQQRDKAAPNFLSAEALVYFIRRADRNGDTKMRGALFRELFERCIPYFRRKFRGFDREDDREDLQSKVIERVVEDLLAEDNRGDFMQVQFWKYLKYKCIDACRITLRHTKDAESLDTSYYGDDLFEGETRLEKVVDPRLSPEELTMIREELAKLPQHLRDVFLMRHYLGMKIGSDDSAEVTGDELTIAAHFNCTGRTIRNRLKEADRLLASF